MQMVKKGKRKMQNRLYELYMFGGVFLSFYPEVTLYGDWGHKFMDCFKCRAYLK